MRKLEQDPRDAASINDIIHLAVDLARTCLQMDVAFVTEFKDCRRIFRHLANRDDFVPIKVGQSDPIEESYCQYVVNGAIPAVVDDSHIYPILKRLDATQLLQIRAHLGVPIWLSDGSVFGTFCCYSRNPTSTLRDVDIQAMSRFAKLIAVMLENRVLRERAQEAISARLQDLMARRALHIAYQPIFDLSTETVVGVEALARFAMPPQMGPDQWFADAHRVDRGAELELLAIELAIENIERLPPGAYLALNVSPHTMLGGGLAQRLRGAPLDRLVLEVTEHVPIEEYAGLSAELAPLRRAGLRLAIDDAGSGYASFRHILQLRPDIIKLDRSLICDIHLDPGRRALASALTAFATETGSKVVAEGIESRDELAVLRELGVHAGQGWLLGRPAPLLG
jgi:EAL domain-containing protein (putative c-di-GMP-specific phosphodiesterase class I)